MLAIAIITALMLVMGIGYAIGTQVGYDRRQDDDWAKLDARITHKTQQGGWQSARGSGVARDRGDITAGLPRGRATRSLGYTLPLCESLGLSQPIS